jgi:hypothetical protein
MTVTLAKKHVEAPTDKNETPYAYAFARANTWGDGAELHLKLYRVCGNSFLHSLSLDATAYVSRDFSGVYGIRLVSDESGRHELNDLRAMLKTMERIEKRLEAFNNELGYAKGDGAYAEFCRRVCVAAGITHAFIESGYNTGFELRDGYRVSSVFDLRRREPRKDGAGFLLSMQTLTDETLKARGKVATTAE